MTDAAFVVDSPQAMRDRLADNIQEAKRRNAIVGRGYMLTSDDLAYRAKRERQIALLEADNAQRDALDRATGKLIDLPRSAYAVIG